MVNTYCQEVLFCWNVPKIRSSWQTAQRNSWEEVEQWGIVRLRVGVGTPLLLPDERPRLQKQESQATEQVKA